MSNVSNVISGLTDEDIRTVFHGTTDETAQGDDDAADPDDDTTDGDDDASDSDQDTTDSGDTDGTDT
jgi:hypothetical protein